MKRNSKSLIYKTSWSAVSSLSIIFSSIVTSVITARILGPSGVGHLAFLIWIIDMMAVMSGVGLQNTITRFMAELTGQEYTDQIVALQKWIFPKFILCTIVGVIILAYLGLTSNNPYESLGVWIALPTLFFLRSVASLYMAFLAGLQRFDIAARTNFISNTIQVVGVISGGYYLGISGVILGYALAAVAPAVMSLSMLIPINNTVSLNKALRSRILNYTMDTWFALIVSTLVWSRIEIFFIQKYWDNKTVAMFSISLSLGAIAVQAPMLLTGAVMPHLAEQVGASNKEAIQRIYSSGTRLVGLVLFPICCICAAMAPVLIPFLYGEPFAPAIPTAQIIIVTSILSFATIGTSVVMALGKSRFIALSGLIGASASLLGCFILIPKYGSLGAAVSRAIVQCSMIALGSWYIHYWLKVRMPFRTLIFTALASILSAIPVFLFVETIGGINSIIFSIPISLVVYIAAIRIFKIINSEDEVLFEIALSHFPASFNRIIYRTLGMKTR